jgi:C4-dicarboxylate-specific signal transduction histidine kinase
MVRPAGFHQLHAAGDGDGRTPTSVTSRSATDDDEHQSASAPATPINGHAPPADAESSERIIGHDAELVRLARFTALGDMLDDLVHEMNQPLAAIVSYARGCALRVAAGTLAQAELEDMLGRIADHALGAAAQLRRMKDLARDGSGERTLVDLSDVVRDVAAFGRVHAEHRGCTIHLAPQGALPPVHADRIKIGQVVLCMVRSCIALSTRPQKPEVWLQASPDTSQRVEVLATTFAPAASPMLRSGSGESMDGALPFGLQLELARARAIVAEHGGPLETFVEPGTGAWFRFALPHQKELPS